MKSILSLRTFIPTLAILVLTAASVFAADRSASRQARSTKAPIACAECVCKVDGCKDGCVDCVCCKKGNCASCPCCKGKAKGNCCAKKSGCK